jgi:hypothetical protein
MIGEIILALVPINAGDQNSQAELFLSHLR